MREKVFGPGTITPKTRVPIELLVPLAGLCFWVAGVYADGKQNARDVVDVKSQQAEYMRLMLSIDQRLARIEGALSGKK